MSKTRHQELKLQIERHNALYHSQDNPEISDFQYDQLFQELLDLEALYPELVTPESPSQRVGGEILSAFKKVPHKIPMLSLANSYSPEDLMAFDERVKKNLKNNAAVEYFCEPKFDGLALELVYEKGFLVQAITRGDGYAGEDVTHNVRTIKTIPLTLRMAKPPPLLEVRGEVLIFKKDFVLMNAQQQEAGEIVFANPRNAAAGTIRQLDSKIAATRPLRFFAYGLGQIDGVDFESQNEIADYLHQAGLPVATDYAQLCLGASEIISYYKKIETRRHEMIFDIDGIVVKINSIPLQNDLGMVARSPRWATAAKFKPEQASTTVESIQVQVGRTGALTPVAIMKPVKVGGVTVTSATLHNQDEIDRKDIRIGDTVIIQRAGDVIPEIVAVVAKHRPHNSKPYKISNNCPTCAMPAQKLEGEVVSRCVNSLCPSILKESLKHFTARRAMNIEKVGDRLVETLVETGLVKSYSDLYRLDKQSLLSLERQGDKSVNNILKSIEDSKKTTLARLIFAFGIRFVGEQTAKLIADHFINLDSFLIATNESLLQIPEIGPKVSDSIVKWLSNKKLVNEAHALIQCGLVFETTKRSTTGPLSEFSFVITGTLPVKRDVAQTLIEKNGGKILSSVSSKLSFLVVGDDPGSKAEKAQRLEVKIITWDELLHMIATMNAAKK